MIYVWVVGIQLIMLNILLMYGGIEISIFLNNIFLNNNNSLRSFLNNSYFI